MKETLAIMAVIMVVIGSLWASISVWTECRDSHSFLYCFYTLSK